MSSSWDLYVDQGVQYDTTFTFLDPSGAPIDLTSWTATLVVESTYGGTALVTLSSPASGLVITPAAGTIAVTFTATQTGLMVLSRYFWRIDTTDASAIARRYLRGSVFVAFK